MGTLKIGIKRKCAVCGNVFLAKFLDSKCCSPKCIKIASARKKAEELRMKRLDELKAKVPDARDYISIAEAEAIFGVSKKTLHRLVRKGEIQSINLGTRLTRISKSQLLERYPLREEPINRQYALPKLYNMEPENCYTIGENCEKYKINDSSVWSHVRKYGIPSRQIGNYVYIPKEEIDNLYKSEV